MKTKVELRRWYDNKPYTKEVLEILKHLSIRSHYEIAREIIKVIDIVKAHNKEASFAPLSLGVDRVLGLYRQQNKRRWYDNSMPLTRVFKAISCLNDEDFQNIMQGILMSLKEETND